MQWQSIHFPSHRRASRFVPSCTNPAFSYTCRARGLKSNTSSETRCTPTTLNA